MKFGLSIKEKCISRKNKGIIFVNDWRNLQSHGNNIIYMAPPREIEGHTTLVLYLGTSNF